MFNDDLDYLVFLVVLLFALAVGGYLIEKYGLFGENE